MLMITPSGSKTLCNFWIFPLTVLVLFMQGCATTKPTSVDPSAYKGRTKSIINEQVGHSGLFDVHPAETCRIGVLPNGDDSFERNLEYFLKIKESRGIFNTNIYWKATRKVLDNTTKVDMNHITDE
jgi:hypothetical protein